MSTWLAPADTEAAVTLARPPASGRGSADGNVSASPLASAEKRSRHSSTLPLLVTAYREESVLATLATRLRHGSWRGVGSLLAHAHTPPRSSTAAAWCWP
eukprot:scaffold46068_cov68-Phaeocystis_antarctica.AAC.2